MVSLKKEYFSLNIFYKKIILSLIGFLLSIILTIIPFYIVMYENFSYWISFNIIVFSSILQVIIHLIFFLDFKFKSKKYQDKWITISLFFSTIIICILTLGSFWIMYNLNYNMSLLH